MSSHILHLLSKETEEEKVILEQNRQVRKDLYTNKADFIIESDKLLDPDQLIMVRKHTRFVDFPKHKHDYIEMNYVYSGKLEQKVGDQQIVLQKGELLLLNQFIEHEIKACEREDIIINFIIRPRFFEYIFSYLSGDNIENNINEFLINSMFEHTQSGQFLYFQVSHVASIQELIHNIIAEIMEPSLMSQSTIKFYMGLLFIELIKHADKMVKQNEGSSEQQVIMKVLKYIDEHYKEASLNQLAIQLHQPHYRLSKNIKKITNKTFKELLQDKRLRESKELLKNNELPISSVIEQIGYDNVSYFYRIFKNKYGLTPKQFRERFNNTFH